MRILSVIRGLVRPLTLLAIVGGVVGLAVYHGVTVDAKEAALFLAAFGGPAVGFYFRGRVETSENGWAPTGEDD